MAYVRDNLPFLALNMFFLFLGMESGSFPSTPRPIYVVNLVGFCQAGFPHRVVSPEVHGLQYGSARPVWIMSNEQTVI